MNRRTALIGAGCAITALAIAGALVSLTRADATDVSAAADPVSDTAEISTKTLARTQDFEGTLGYGTSRSVRTQLGGTLTSLAPEGTVVDRGEVIASVDNRHVRLMLGTTPAYRTLEPEMSDGPDVAQLEQNLIDLGFGNGDLAEADDEWTAATTRAVQRWQKAQGVPSAERDGRIEFGEVVFEPGAVRMGPPEAEVGSVVTTGQAIASITGTAKMVTFQVTTERRGDLAAGDTVTVVLPDGSETTGTVLAVGREATGGDDGAAGDDPGAAASEATLNVSVALSDQASVPDLDSAPVTVEVIREERPDVTVAPVDALVALSEGGYALRVVDGTTSRLEGVEIGMFADGWVEVSGDGIESGVTIEVPR